MADKENVFEPATKEERTQILQECAKHLSDVTTWTNEQEILFDTQLTHFSLSSNSFYCHLPKDLDFDKYLNSIEKSGGLVFFNTKHPKGNFFYKAKFLEKDNLGLKYQAPETLFKVQRRQSVRFIVPDHYSIRIELEDSLFPGQTISRKLLNLSASGLAFLVPEQDQSLYPKGMIINQVRFKLPGKLIIADVEVVHTSLGSGAKTGSCKVGTRFAHIDKDVSKMINSYVLEESSKNSHGLR